jgi:CheY-like chemotaxis protein
MRAPVALGSHRFPLFTFIHLEWNNALLSDRDLHPLGARRWVGALSNLLVILVVEDDAPIQCLVEDALADVGFEPAIAASGEEAVTLLTGNKGKYRALVTDIQLRGVMEGWEVAKKAREIDPEFPIVYITGGNAAEWPSHGVPNSILLTKPFAPAQLVTAVSQLLNAGSPPTAPS